MPITPAQRERRRRWLGASDFPAILGIDPFRTPADVQASKLYSLDQGDDAPSEAAELGNDLEPMLLDWAAKQVGARIRKGGPTRRPQGRFAGYPVGANPDAIRLDKPGEGFEAKYTSKKDEWGTPGTSEVPDRVAIQCQIQMGVCDLQRIWVPVMMPAWKGLTRQLFVVDRNDEVIDKLFQIGRAWWRQHVDAAEIITQSWPAMEVLQQIEREPDSQTDIPITLAFEWEQARKAKLAAEKVEKAAKSRMVAAMANKESARLMLPDGEASGLTLIYKEIHVKERHQDAFTYRKPQVFKPKGVISFADRLAELEAPEQQQLEEMHV